MRGNDSLQEKSGADSSSVLRRAFLQHPCLITHPQDAGLLTARQPRGGSQGKARSLCLPCTLKAED